MYRGTVYSGTSMIYCQRNDRTPGHAPIHHKIAGLDYLYAFPAEGLGYVIVRVKADGCTVVTSLIESITEIEGIDADPSN